MYKIAGAIDFNINKISLGMYLYLRGGDKCISMDELCSIKNRALPRVARWFILKPKIPVKVSFGGLLIENVDIFFGHLEFFTNIRDILKPFGTFCVHLVHFVLFLVSCTKKKLATLALPSTCRYIEHNLTSACMCFQAPHSTQHSTKGISQRRGGVSVSTGKGNHLHSLFASWGQCYDS
jgi:hypothetical protein